MDSRIRRASAWLAIWALLLAMSPVLAASAAAPVTVTVGQLTAAPTLDGVISAGEWGAADLSLHNYRMATNPCGASKSALDGQVWLGWDAAHFYLAVAAVTDTQKNAYTGYNVIKDCALQVQIAADGKTERHELAFARSADGKMRGYIDDLAYSDISAFCMATRDEATKTTVYEASLPLSLLSDSVSAWKKGDRIAFSFAVRVAGGYAYEWCGGLVEGADISKAAAVILGVPKDQNDGSAAIVTGDANGDGRVDATDARLALQCAAGLPAAIDAAAADADGDGTVTSTDARLMLQYYAGKGTDYRVGQKQTVLYGAKSAKAVSHNTFSPMSSQAGSTFKSLSDIGNTTPTRQDDNTNQFGYFVFTTDLNEGLPFNVRCHISSGMVTAMVPAGVDLTALIPTFTYFGGEIRVNGMPLISDVTLLDLTEDVTLTLISKSGNVRTYTLRVEALDTGLPSFAATVEGLKTVTSKIDYLPTLFYIGGGEAGAGRLMPGGMKGRGNTSWNEPKKGYTVELKEKVRLLDMSESKDWSLIANYEDKALLRNILAEYLAEGAGLEYVVQNRPVDLWYNGQYWGTYNLVEKIEVEKDRVNIKKYEPGCEAGDTGFVLEFDGHVNEVSADQKAQWQHPIGEDKAMYYNPVTQEVFMTYDGRWIVIKKPSYKKLETDTKQLLYIYNKYIETVKILKTYDYQKISRVVDVASFARWYIVEEFMNNTDASFHSSCYMYLDAGGKFKMGPVWDFDRSCENCYYWNAEENLPSMKNAGWLAYILGCDGGMAVFEDVYEEFRPTLDRANRYVADMADAIYASQQYNFQKWDILTKLVNGGDVSNPNATTKAQMKSQTFDAEICRLQNYITRRTLAFDLYMLQV